MAGTNEWETPGFRKDTHMRLCWFNPDKRSIGCRWIYKIKKHSDGSSEWYKVRLIAKGYSKKYDIDYRETFAPLVRMIYVQGLLAVVAAKQWPLFWWMSTTYFSMGPPLRKFSLYETISNYFSPIPKGLSSSSRIMV